MDAKIRDAVTLQPCGHTFDLGIVFGDTKKTEGGGVAVALSLDPDDLELVRQIIEGETPCPKCPPPEGVAATIRVENGALTIGQS